MERALPTPDEAFSFGNMVCRSVAYVPTARQSNICMREDKDHVPPMSLWGYSSGTENLSDENLEHLLFCIECQTLVNQFMDVINGLPPMNPSQAA